MYPLGPTQGALVRAICTGLLAVLGWGWLASAGELARSPRMNVLLIVSDDQGMGDFGSFGNPVLSTPVLDQLRSESMTLSRFYTSPICSPSRASLMTGRYNLRTGVWDTRYARMNMNPEEVTIAEIMRDAGYRTGLFGKWHLGYNHPQRPMDNGFDRDFQWFGARTRFGPLMENNGLPERREGYLSDIYFEEAIRFIEAGGGQPFFAFISTFLPHDYPGEQVPDEDIAPYRDVANLSEADAETYAMIARMDRNIGKVLDRLDAAGLAENTIVIFLPDNGPDLLHPARPPETRQPQPRFNMGLRGGKGTVYEGGIRVPAFVRWPGLTKAESESAAPVAHIDLLPTILEMCSIPAPEDVSLDGLSFVPLLNGSTDTMPPRILAVSSDRSAVPDRWTNSCVIDGDFKLVNGRELYNLAADPGESLDIAELSPDIVKRLRTAYDQWFDDVVPEGGLVSGRTSLGASEQTRLRLKWWDQDESGWPVNVVRPGTFSITVDDIQTDLLSPNSELVISAAGQTYRSLLKPDEKAVTVEGLEFEPGATHLSVVIEGMQSERILTYGQMDLGYRDVFVEFTD